MTATNLFSHHTQRYFIYLTTLLVGTCLVTGLTLSESSYANPMGKRSPIQWQQLQLKPQQKQAIQSLDKEWQETYSNIQPKIEMDRSKLRQMLSKPAPDENQVMEIQHRLQKNSDSLHAEATRIFMKKKQQLTPQQRQQLNHMMKKHRGGH